MSRPHPQPEPRPRLVTKARKQEWEDEQRADTAKPKVRAALNRPKAALPPTPPPVSQSEKRSMADSPNLIALLTGAKKKN